MSNASDVLMFLGYGTIATGCVDGTLPIWIDQFYKEKVIHILQVMMAMCSFLV